MTRTTLTAPNLPRLLSTKELSEATGIPLRTIEDHRLNGHGIPFVRIGGKVYYNPADVLAYFAANTVAGAR